MKSICLAFCLAFIIHALGAEAFCANPAPYTKEAYQKINALSGRNMPRPDKDMSKEDRVRKTVELMRDIFRQAGYDYEDTIVQVVRDMRNNPEILPRSPESIFSTIYVGTHFMLSECEYSKIDCLQFFRPDAARAVEWLMKNTDFSF